MAGARAHVKSPSTRVDDVPAKQQPRARSSKGLPISERLKNLLEILPKDVGPAEAPPPQNGDGHHPEDDGLGDQVGLVDQAAFYGVLGRIVLKTQEETEANALFVLAHLLGLFASAIGRGPHFVLSVKEPLGLYVATIAPSSSGRKGTAASVAKGVWRCVDEKFTDVNVISGLNSGAGLLYEMRDPSDRKDKKGETIDPGQTDKRRLFIESEFASVLMQGHRENEPLLCYVRQFFDGDHVIRSLTKDPVRVTGGHPCIVGHCTPEELNLHLCDTDKAGGTANRFLWLFGVRSKLLTRRGQLYELLSGPLTDDLEQLKGTIRFAEGVGEVTRSAEVQKRWEELYPKLERVPPGRLGQFFRRAPTIILRIASLFALSDRKKEIECAHLDAALAIWEHSARSLRHLFKADSDPDAERLIAALEAAPEGLMKTDLWRLWENKRSADWFKEFLNKHLTDQTIEKKKDKPKRGRPAERFFIKRW